MKNPPRTVVVTGASAGVGRALAVRLAAHGDRVAVLARGTDGIAAAADEIRQAGGEALPFTLDVADSDRLEEAAMEIENAWGPIDVWVNNAFSSVFARFLDVSPEEFRRATDVTYLGFVNGTRTALSRMVPRDRGVVVQVGSALAYRGIPLQAAYCGAKHAIVGFTESVRTELMHDHSQVRVTMVQLPALNTPQFDWLRSRLPRAARPVPPIYQPEVAAKAIEYATRHPRRREYRVGGSTVAAVAANFAAPALLDHYLAVTGFAAQQTEAASDESAGNLEQPLDEVALSDRGSHGRFDERAHAASPAAWVSRHRKAMALGGAAAGLGATAWARRK